MAKVSLVIKSQLNDAMMEVNVDSLKDKALERLRFVSYLVSTFPNVDEKIDVDEVYAQFKSSQR